MTPAQIQQFRIKALAAGKTSGEIDKYLSAKGYSSSGTANLTSQFEGTQALRATTPSPEVEDPGLTGMLGAAGKENILGPFAGIAERLGIAEEGTRQGIRDDFEETRLNYLAEDPSNTRSILAGLSEIATMAVPLTPGGKVGRLGAAAAAKLGAKAAGSRLAAGAAAGLAEGALVGVGDTVGLEPMDQLKRGALMSLAGGVFGGAGAYKGAKGAKGILEDADPVPGEYLRRYVAGDPSREGVLGKLGDAVNAGRAHWIDEHAPYIDKPRKLLAAAQKAGKPQSVIDRLQADLTEAMLRADSAKVADNIALYPVEKYTIDPLTTKATGEGLVPILEELAPDELSDFVAVGLARRQLELTQRKADAGGLLPEFKDALKEAKASGAKPADIKALEREVARLGRDADLKINPEDTARSEELLRWFETTDKYATRNTDLGKSLERFRDWSVRAMIDPLAKVGVFSKDEVADMLAKNEWYMPFIRAAEYIEGRQLEFGLGAPKKGKTIHGGLSEEILMKNPLESAAEMAVRVQTFARKQGVRNHLGDMADRYADELGDEIKLSTSQHVGDTFRVWRDGELLNYSADKGLVKAVESLNPSELNLLSNAAMQVNNVFRASATLSPQFSFRNLFKDWFTFSTMSRHTKLGPLSIARAVAGELHHRFGNQGRASDLWKEFELSSGYHGTFLSRDRTGVGVERTVKLAKELGEAGTSARRRQLEMKRNPLAPLQALGQAIERMPRFTEYRAARKGGLDPRAAGHAAGEATLPFHRAGSIGKRVNRYEAFFNAQMQDMSKFYRAMREKPFGTTMKGMAWMTAPSMYFWAKNANDPEYQSLPEWEKVLFIHTHKMENGKYFRVPLPPGILGLVFSYMPRKMLDHFYGNDPDAIGTLMEEAWEQTPLQYFPAPGLNSAQDAFLRMMPTAVQPIAEVLANRNPFFDRPVISQRLLGVDKNEQKTQYTTNLAKWTAGAAGSLPFASDTMAASPVVVDYLLAGYGASLGRMGAKLTGQEARTRRMGGIEALGLQSTSPVGFSSEPVQDLYELSEMIQKSKNTLNIQSSTDRQRNYLSLHPEAAYSKQINRVKENLKRYSLQRTAILEDDSLSDVMMEESLLRIDQEITMYAAVVMGEFSKAIDRDKRIEAENQGDAN